MEINNKLITNALRYMRVPPDRHDQELFDFVAETFEKIEGFLNPKFIWSKFGMEKLNNGIKIADTEFISDDILRLMQKSEECVLLAVTLGAEIDRQIILSQKNNMLDGIALDACASVLVDEICNDMTRKKILPELNQDQYLTSRFSPGYGDLNLKYNKDIIEILNATKMIGLSVTGSYMMTPVKSVTALVGIKIKCRSQI